MCFAPQARALFECLNWQKCSEPEVFCTFWIQNVLCATAASTFSTAQPPKVVREWEWCVFYVFTSACVSRHSCVQFSTSQLPKAVWPGVFCNFLTTKCASDGSACTRRFSEPTFRPSRATEHWKNTVFRVFLPFRGSDMLSSFHIDSSDLCFSICPYCRKFDF